MLPKREVSFYEKTKRIEGDIGLLSPLEYYYAYSVPVDLSACILCLRLPGETTQLFTKQAGSKERFDFRSSAISLEF